MIQHVAEWVCKCTYCSSVVDMSVKMSMADGNYLLQFTHHDCTKSEQDPPEVTYSAKTLSRCCEARFYPAKVTPS